MNIFKKQETLTQNIAYMSLMAAINVIFVLLSTLVPFLLFILVFILPLTSLVVTYYCKKQYFPIYFIVTISLCCLVTIWNIADTIFYVIPAMVSGFIFGFFLDKKYPVTIIIIVAIIAQQLLMYASIPLIYAIYQRDIVVDFISIFGLQNFKYVNYLKHMFIAILAIIQISISFIVMFDEISKFNIAINDKNESIAVSIIIIGLSLIMVLFAFVFPEYVYAILFYIIYLSIYLIFELCSKKQTWIIITMFISLIVTFFVFSSCYKSLNKDLPLGFLTIAIFPLALAVIAVLNKYLFNKAKGDKIVEKL